MNQDCWLLVYLWQLEKNKDWSGGVMEYWSGGKEHGLECWPPAQRATGPWSLRFGESIGVLGLKAEMDLIFTRLPLIIRDPNMVCIFPSKT